MLTLRAVLFLAAFRAVAPENDWPKFRHDLPNAGAFPASSAQVNTVLFEADIGARAQSSPSYRDDVVYVGTDAGVVAAARWSGAVLWRTSAPPVGFSSPLVLARQRLPGRAGHVVLVVGLDGQLYAFNGADGGRLWATPVGGISASPSANSLLLLTDTVAARVFLPGTSPEGSGRVRSGLWAINALSGRCAFGPAPKRRLKGASQRCSSSHPGNSTPLGQAAPLGSTPRRAAQPSARRRQRRSTPLARWAQTA